MANFEQLFFVNLACETATTAAPSADVSTACVRAFTDVKPATDVITNTADTTTGISFYEGSKYGYMAQAKLAACTPGTSTDLIAATTVNFSQECFNIASGVPNTVKNVLVRQNTTDPKSVSKEVIFAAPLSMLFTDVTCM